MGRDAASDAGAWRMLDEFTAAVMSVPAEARLAEHKRQLNADGCRSRVATCTQQEAKRDATG